MALAVSGPLLSHSEEPDLSGTWDFRTTTPLEKPQQPPPPSAGESPWSDHGSAVPEDDRESLIVAPKSGKLPELVPGAEHQQPSGALPEHGAVRIRVGGLGDDGPEQRGLSERCLQGFNSGPPIVPGFYNQNLRILQTSDHVLLVTEMIHDARIVRLDSPHEDETNKRWLGDSVGRWESDELVIDTTNFTPKIASFAPNPFEAIGNAANLHLVERLRLLDEDTLRYEFTVEDPSTFVTPFTAVLLMRRTDERLYEYACHEGNKPMFHMLWAARAEGRE